MAKQMVAVEVPIGWRAIEVRRPKRGECFLRDGHIGRANFDFISHLIIVEREDEFKEDGDGKANS